MFDVKSPHWPTAQPDLPVHPEGADSNHQAPGTQLGGTSSELRRMPGGPYTNWRISTAPTGQPLAMATTSSTDSASTMAYPPTTSPDST
jgi:hypothetical protein